MGSAVTIAVQRECLQGQEQVGRSKAEPALPGPQRHKGAPSTGSGCFSLQSCQVEPQFRSWAQLTGGWFPRQDRQKMSVEEGHEGSTPLIPLLRRKQEEPKFSIIRGDTVINEKKEGGRRCMHETVGWLSGWTKALGAKPKDRSSMPRFHMVEGAK